MAAVAVEPDPPAMLTAGGPEPMTKNEAIALAEQLTHRKMKVQRMPRPVARLAIRLLAKRYDALATAFGAVINPKLRRVGNGVVRLTCGFGWWG
jgi:hypothetical protein